MSFAIAPADRNTHATTLRNCAASVSTAVLRPVRHAHDRFGRMNRCSLAGLVALAAAVLICSGCAPTATADLTVTYTDGSEQAVQELALTDLSCKTSSVVRVISSESVTSDGDEVFLATAPTDGRDTYTVSLWFDGFRFISAEEFEAAGSTITFNDHPGFVTESPNGHQPASEDTKATLNGTIACG